MVRTRPPSAKRSRRAVGRAKSRVRTGMQATYRRPPLTAMLFGVPPERRREPGAATPRSPARSSACSVTARLRRRRRPALAAVCRCWHGAVSEGALRPARPLPPARSAARVERLVTARRGQARRGPARPPLQARDRHAPAARRTYERLLALRIAGIRAFVDGPRAGRARGARRRARARSSRRTSSVTDRIRLNEGNRRWWTLGGDVLRAVHDHARQHRRERGAAVHPGRPRRHPLRPRVDGQRLHAHLRRPARHRRAAGRHLRPPAHVPVRRRGLRALERRDRPRPRPGLARRRAARSRASAPRS